LGRALILAANLALADADAATAAANARLAGKILAVTGRTCSRLAEAISSELS